MDSHLASVRARGGSGGKRPLAEASKSSATVVRQRRGGGRETEDDEDIEWGEEDTSPIVPPMDRAIIVDLTSIITDLNDGVQQLAKTLIQYQQEELTPLHRELLDARIALVLLHAQHLRRRNASQSINS